VIQLGEEPWRVTLSGAPSLDNLGVIDYLNRGEIADKFDLHLSEAPFLLVTYHPVTLEYEQTGWQISELLAALADSGMQCVFTMPNADTHGSIIREKINAFTASQASSQAVESLGTQGYFSLMKLASAMVGNSSSGMVEAASFELPVVNVGIRQSGRVSGANILHVDYPKEDVLEGIRKAVSPRFRSGLKGIENPYGTQGASKVIVKVLKEIQINTDLIMKRFYDLE